MNKTTKKLVFVYLNYWLREKVSKPLKKNILFPQPELQKKGRKY